MARRSCVVARAVVFFIVIGAAAWSQAQEPAYTKYRNGIGFSVGQISGTGISYRRWVTEKVGLQVSAGALYMPGGGPAMPMMYPYSSNLLDYWAGAEVMRSLFAAELTKWLYGQVYLFAGASHFGYIPWNTIFETVDPGDGTPPYEQPVGFEAGTYVPGFEVGAGIGIEVGLFQHFSLAFELGYAVLWVGVGGAIQDQMGVMPVPQGVVQFRY